jgi:hypothetical protein
MWKRKTRAAKSEPEPTTFCDVCGARAVEGHRCERHVGAVFNRDVVRGEYETRDQ